MKNIPYQSFRISDDYELNIYGDPDNPVGVEVGVYRSLLNSPEAKKNCLDFMASFLKPEIKDGISSLKRDVSNKTVVGDLTIEITPPEEPDSYAGWWISVYDEEKLNSVRAKTSELAAITVPKSEVREDSSNAWSSADMAQARSPSYPNTVTTTVRPTPTPTPSYYVPSSGLVYVRGYYRKDGTYVQSHTRRKPSR